MRRDDGATSPAERDGVLHVAADGERRLGAARCGSSISSGAMPRPSRSGRGLPAMTRTTRNRRPAARSAGRDAGRRRQRRRACAPPRALSVSTGSPLILPEVATSGPPKSLEQQMMQRAVGQEDADFARARARAPALSRAIRRACAPARSAAPDRRSAALSTDRVETRAHARRAVSAIASGNITASGLCGRCLRARKRCDRASSRRHRTSGDSRRCP